MNDPHVEWIRYRIETGPTFYVTDPSPQTYETDGFTLRLEADKLTALMIEHHASIDSARERVEPFLRSWERDNDLTYGPLALRFIREDARVIDRDPPPPGTPQTFRLQAQVGSLALIGGEATFRVGRREYPPPPLTFRTTPDVEAMWHHYESHLAGKELLSGMAYFCLTVVLGLGGGKKKASSMFQIDVRVLSKLGELSSKRGDMKTARKSIPQPRPYQPQEETWIKDVVHALIRRVGEYAANAQLRKLTMADFPPLS